MRFALLVSPSANRVYAQAASALAMAELGAIDERVLGGAFTDVREQSFGSVSYVTFSAPELSELSRAWLSNLSATLALFRVDADGRFAPLELERWDVLDSDLLTVQRYAGKTHEGFTKLLLNVTWAASAFARERRPLSVLDPLCGRGTTLNHALCYGFHATGVEHDKKAYDAYLQFIQRWVKDKRLKHTAVCGHVKGHPKLDLAFALDKDRFKAGEVQRLTYVNADTHAIADVFQPRSFDLIVTDAPYGVQHGAHAEQTTSRSPLELLTSALPIWRAALRAGGAIGIAWNTRGVRREKIAEILAKTGLEVVDSPAYRGFEHRVDASIQRDLIVARVTSP